MTLLANRYKLDRPLGEGGEGQVWAAEDQWRQGYCVAIKQLNPSSSSSLTREFASLKRLKHPHIVEALDLIYVDSIPYLVQERVFGVTLSQWSETNSPEALLKLVSPIAHALAHLHARGWVHFDPTAANILVDDQTGRAYLIDLGLVQPIGAEVIGGTPGFIAPELFEGHEITDKVDSYTLAKSIRELLNSSETASTENSDLTALLESACCSDPYKRPSAYRLAKGFIELSGSDDDDFLYRPLTQLPFCAREELRTQFSRWNHEPGSAFVYGGASGNGLTAFSDYCVEQLKLRGFGVLKVSGQSQEPIREMLAQAVSLAPENSTWLIENQGTLRTLVEHPRLRTQEPVLSVPLSAKECCLSTALLLEKFATQIPLALVVDDYSPDQAHSQWDFLVPIFKDVGAKHELRVILNEGDGCDDEMRRLEPFSREEVVQFLTLAYAYSPAQAEVDYLIELASGRPKLLQAALFAMVVNDKTILELTADDLVLLDTEPLPPELKPLSVISGAIPNLVLKHFLEKVGEESLLWRWIHEGFLVPLGVEAEPAVFIPHIYRSNEFEPKWYAEVAGSYRQGGFEFEAQLLELKGHDHLSEKQVDSLLALAPPSSVSEVFYEIYKRFGVGTLTVEQRAKWAIEASEIGDVTAVELATEALGNSRSTPWKTARLGGALNRVGRFNDCLEKAKLHLEDVDCAAVFARAQLSSGNAAEAVESARPFQDSQNAMIANTLGSALCQIGQIEEGITTLVEAVGLAEESSDIEILGRAWHALAIAYQRSSRTDESMSAYQRALEYSNPISFVFRSLNYATLLQDIGFWGEAERRFRESMSRSLTLGNKREQSRSGVNLANILVLSGQLEEGARMAEWTAAMCEKEKLLYPQAMANLVLAESFLERNDVHGASNPLGAAKTLLESISDPTALAEWRLLDARAALLGEHYTSANLAFESLKEESLYPELRWRVLLWRTYAKLVQGLAITEGDIKLLEDSLEEIREEKNLRFEWKLLALLGESLRQSSEVQAAEITTLGSAKAAEWRTLLSSQEKLSYFRTYFRRELLSYLEEVAPQEVPSMDMTPHVSFIRKLVSINRRLAREHDVDILLELIVDSAIELVGAERGFILLRQDDGVEVAVARNLEKRSIDDGSHGISRSIATEVLSTGERILTTNAAEDSRFAHAKSVSAFKLRSVLCFPLRASRRGEDRLIGSLYLDNRFQERAFSENDMELCAALADQASIALENARLFSEIRSQETALESQNKQLEGLNSELQKEVALYANQAEEALRRLREEGPSVGVGEGFERFVGSSDSLKEALRLVERFADTDVPILIRGESGTGKELVARAFHERSRRKTRSFVSINCGAIPAELIESELFGYKKGAFTGATKDKKGLIGESEGGTLFLDEIGEMSLAMQVKLLRVLQEREYRPVGSNQTLSCDIRILSATHRNLPVLIEEGKFREDFYYRIQVVEVPLPPLRERREDIPALVDHFCQEMGQCSLKESFSEDALATLMAYDWPGNIRELENEIRRSLALADDVVGVVDLSEKLQRMKQVRRTTLVDNSRGSLREIMDGFEKEVLLAALERNKWNVKKTADELGLSRASFYTRLKRFGIKR